MEGRKMAVVPFKLWEDMKRWKEEQIQKPRLPPDPNVSATASLQRDLSSVMANEDLSEAEKSQLFGQTLHKFKTAHRKALAETKLSLPVESEAKINQRIFDSVPTTMRKKAKLLVSWLENNPNLSWDEDGRVKMYGKPVAGSNIIDLVTDVLRQRKDTEPRGWEPFAEVLRDMNVPQDFVGNKKRWEWMHRTPPKEEEEEYVTPKTKHRRMPTLRKRTSPIAISVRKRIKKDLSQSLSATRKHIRDELFSPSSIKPIKEELFDSPRKWLSYDEQ